jgi:predicted Fe-S protein YdhL (DUF1289 family)
MKRKKVLTPCISVCRLDDKNICIGCGRTKREIREWLIYSDKRRSAIMLRLNQKHAK